MGDHRTISIADQIFELLERDILSGKYPRGEVLSELRLSEELGVSRTPVREAIRRLEQENILEDTGRGAVVVGISKEDMQDMYEIRSRIEDMAAARAAKNITDEQLATIKEYTRLIAESMHVTGLMNIQYAIEDGKVYVLEANPRASRTVPLVSKVCGIQMVQIATDVMTGEFTGRKSPVGDLKEAKYSHYGVKEAVFPFNMFPEVDPVLGPEMRSTGEVLGLADTFGEAFWKAQEGTQTVLPKGGSVLISVSDLDKRDLVEVGQAFADAGFEIVATRGTRDMLMEAGIPATLTLKASEGRPNLIDMILNEQVDIIVNTPSANTKSTDDGALIRRTAIKMHVPYFTTMAAAKAAAVGIADINKKGESKVKSLQNIHADIK